MKTNEDRGQRGRYYEETIILDHNNDSRAAYALPTRIVHSRNILAPAGRQ